MRDPIVIRCDQGSQEWHDVRLGIPTASNLDKILTAAKLDLSKQSWKYRNRLLGDWIAGYPASEIEASGFMERGTEQEPRARAAYQFERDMEVEQVGFVLRADGRVGCSPDGLVGDDGGLELKVPAIDTHVGYHLDPAALVADYRLQVQGSLWITGRAWWDILSFNSSLPPVVVRVEPDPAVIGKLDAAVGAFLDDLDDKKRRLADYREQRPDGFVSPLPGERTSLLADLEHSIGPVEAMAAEYKRLAGSNVR